MMKNTISYFYFILMITMCSTSLFSQHPRNTPVNFEIQEHDRIISAKIFNSDNKTIAHTWHITASLLGSLITEEDCLEADAESCSDIENNSLRKQCTYPCLWGDPQLILKNHPLKKIIISQQLGIGGNSGAPVILFVADPTTHFIKKLAPSSTDPDDAQLSPTGTTLALAFSGYRPSLQLINISNSQTFDVQIPQPTLNNSDNDTNKTPVIFLDQLRWINKDRLELRERVYPNKWSTDENPSSVLLKEITIDFENKTGIVKLKK